MRGGPAVLAVLLVLGLVALPACDEVVGSDPADDLEYGSIRGTVTSAAGSSGGEMPFEWGGAFSVRDRLATEEGDRTVFYAENPPLDRRDTTLTVIIPRTLAVGATEIGAYPLGGGALTGAAAYLRVGTEGVDLQIYYSLAGGTLTVTDATYPERPGLLFGASAGSFSFRATRYVAGPEGQPLPTADTILVRGEFLVGVEHLIQPTVSLTLEGAGPVQGASVRANGQAATDGIGGILVWWDADFDGVPHGYPYEASQEFRLYAPAVGSYPIAALTPAMYADPDLWPAAFSVLYYRDDPRTGLSDAGSLDITVHTVATSEFYGEIHGALTTTLALWDAPATPSGETVTATATFAIPTGPLGAVPNLVGDTRHGAERAHFPLELPDPEP